MQREMISKNQMICIVILFLFGSNAVMGGSWRVGQDAWIAILVALAAGTVLALMYARIIRLFPQKNIYEIAEYVFGKIIGKILIFLMVWYAVHLSAILLRLLSEFTKIAMLQETPHWAMILLIICVTGYIGVSGIKTLGRWLFIVLAFYLLSVLDISVMSLSEFKVANLFPIMEHNIADIGSASLKIFTTAFGSTVLLLALTDSLEKKENPYKVYLYGIFFGTVILLFVFVTNVMFLGVPMLEKSYFPSYTMARLVNVGDFLSRVESIIYYNFLLTGIAKLAICLLAAIKGVETMFKTRKRGWILLALSVVVLVAGMKGFANANEVFSFVDIFQYYALLFQILIPFIVWIGAEIKVARQRGIE
ncbi:GerAB/ArcD/ProY family transporter [Anaerosinus massiliensis]|uniref:GerAB/ArcD/ProY family transporter n=1 Tax=Massilibacillus massiliensis TaxID=1806837 RepID=UPI000DA6071F|nr:endospore germination permease [Massilibacillus massiliensis]